MFSVFIFLLGLAVGSFLNVVICRLENKEPIIFGRSHCPKCGAVLKWFDLIPLLSFLLQRGRCRYCHKKISFQYPMVEIFTGAIFLLIFNFQFSIFNLLIACFLIIIFVYDLKHYIIPDKVIFPAILLALVFNWSNILSAVLASGFFLSLVLVSKGKWLGLGDVKLAALMGLILGWPNILLALFLSFLSGAIVGLGLIALGRKSIKSQIPFGPFLSGATVSIMLCSSNLLLVDNFHLSLMEIVW